LPLKKHEFFEFQAVKIGQMSETPVIRFYTIMNSVGGIRLSTSIQSPEI